LKKLNEVAGKKNGIPAREIVVPTYAFGSSMPSEVHDDPEMAAFETALKSIL
jgi:hypothetical protein